MSVPIVGEALKVISEGIKYLTLLSKTSKVRKMQKAIDYAEKYIFLLEELTKSNDPEVLKKGKTRLWALRKAFFKYN